jgi:hypothetical protein
MTLLDLHAQLTALFYALEEGKILGFFSKFRNSHY